MNSKTFLTKINVLTKIRFCDKYKNSSNNRLLLEIKRNFEFKSRPNFWFSSLLTSNRKRVLFDDKTGATVQTSRRGLTGERGSGDEDHNSRDPHLMAFKPILFPNLWYKWKNFITINTIIRPFFDNEFTINEFMFGAKQALVRISSCLADGDIHSLKGLALREIERNYYLMDRNQRNGLRVDDEDIMLSFPYRIGIIMNDDDRRWVEITVVYYCLYKYKSLVQSKQLSFDDFKQKFSKNITICNYRFIREYTKGIESEWTVNLLGHFNNLDSI